MPAFPRAHRCARASAISAPCFAFFPSFPPPARRVARRVGCKQFRGGAGCGGCRAPKTVSPHYLGRGRPHPTAAPPLSPTRTPGTPGAHASASPTGPNGAILLLTRARRHTDCALSFPSQPLCWPALHATAVFTVAHRRLCRFPAGGPRADAGRTTHCATHVRTHWRTTAHAAGAFSILFMQLQARQGLLFVWFRSFCLLAAPCIAAASPLRRALNVSL